MSILRLRKFDTKRLGAVALLSLGCGSTTSISDSDFESATQDGLISIRYRGEVRQAVRRGERVFVEGDIWVDASEVEVINAAKGDMSDVAVASQAVRIQGKNYSWPNGVVPYTFTQNSTEHTLFTAAEQATIVSAMEEITRRVPTITFRAKTASDASYIEFQNHKEHKGCYSQVGRTGAGQGVNLEAPGCLGGFVPHHEIMHALGLYHTQTRKERSQFVTINWANIKGCTSKATNESGCGPAACSSNLADCDCTAADVKDETCYYAGNFASDSLRANIGEYDYDSVMHYGARDFAKSTVVGNTITVLQPGVPAIGQRNHLSNGDIMALRASYPVTRPARVLFHRSGTQNLCELFGREADVGTKWTVTATPALPLVSGSSVDTSQLANNSSYSLSCKAESQFWASNYNYPNTTTVPSYSGVPSSNIEQYAATDTLTVLDAGLMAVLFDAR